MIKLICSIIIICLLTTSAFSQVAINTNGAQADQSSILDLQSTSKGFLLPRMNSSQRNSITNPAEGLMVFCSNCGNNGESAVCVYSNGEWYNMDLCRVSIPATAINLTPPNEIEWRWHPVDGAIGYKWNTVNNFATAIDVGDDTLKQEMGITCDTTYHRYVWAYKECGHSGKVMLTQNMTNCWSCGDVLTINHVAGNVAPVTKTTNYGTVNNIPGEPNKCWLTNNLGSSHQATTVNDTTEASAGWYWQFNRLQGYKHTGIARTPTTTWITTIDEYSDWVSANDPCTHELGQGWRIPTSTEWTNVDAAGLWVNWYGPWNSNLKMHAAGYLNSTTGALLLRGSYGSYWSNSQGMTNTANTLFMFSSSCTVSLYNKSMGFTLRCIMD